MANDKPIGSMKFGIGFDGIDESLNTLDKLNKAIKQNESSMKATISTFDKAGASTEQLALKEKELTTQADLQSKKIQLLEKRRLEYIETYGKESKQVANVTTQINTASAKYNKLSKEIDNTKQAYIIASTGVDKYTKAMADNERAMNDEIKAFKEAGDSAGAYEAKQRGLAKQASLNEKAISAQKQALTLLTAEFGQNSTKVQQAEAKLNEFQRQAKNTDTKLSGLKKGIGDISDEAGELEGGLDKGTAALSGLVAGVAASVSTKALEIISEGVGRITEAFNDALDAQNKFKGALGATGAEAKQYSSFANDLVTSGIAESMDEATDAMVKFKHALPDGADQDPGQLKWMAQNALTLSKTFDMDVNEVVRGATRMMQNYGITGDEAFDLLAQGAQRGLDQSGELADNMAEYSQVFGQMGFSASQTFSILEAGLDGGAYNLDKVNDLAKEMGISLTDGRFEENISMFSAETQKLFGEWKNGGATQGQVVQGMLQDFSKMDVGYDSLNKAGTVWSALGEDNSLKVIQAMASAGDTFKNVEGSMDDLNATAGNTTAWEAFKNGVTGAFTDLGLYLSEFNNGALVSQITGFFEYTLPRWGEKIAGWFGKFSESSEKAKPFLESISNVFERYGNILKVIGEVFLYNFQKGFETLYNFFVDKVAPQLLPLFEKFSGALDRIGKMFEDASADGQGFKTAIDIMWKGIEIALGAMLSAFKITFTAITIALEVSVALITGVWNTFTKLLKGDWAGAWESIKQTVGRILNAIWEGIKDTTLGKIMSSLGTFFKDAFNGFVQWGSDVKEDVSGFMGTIVDWFTNLPNRIAEAFKGGGNAIKDAFKGVFNAALEAIGKPVNGIIKGASWVLEKLGGEPLKEWEVPQYANGTPDGGHPINGPMMVNDGRGAETVITPDGRAFIPKGRNVVLNAPKGTHVLTAEETAQLQGSKAPKYRYKKGTNFFGNLWSNVKGFAGNVGNKLKNVVGDVWDFVSNPEKLAKKVLGGLDILKDLTKYPLDVGKGILSKATSALTSKISEMFSAGSGDLDLGTGTAGVYKYLADVAKSVLSKFPGFQVTSGYRPGDPHSHGKRNAIDIALPGVTGGSPRYTEAANYAFEKFAGKVGYVITNGKVRDRSGQSGTGIHNDWTPWSAGDHYDHVHINGIKDPQNKQLSGENIGGSGVDRWRGVAAQALRMTGQYSASNLAALLNQMRTESNGNPNAINNWDINALNGTPSKGLLQVIDPTFRQYAMPGHNSNIYDPLSNILASIRYALSRYGSLTNAYRGVGYENGGIITKEHIARVGEGNKEEVVIPLTGTGLKRSRAMQLLAYASEKLGASTASISSTSGNTSNVSDMTQMLELMQQQNQLLMAILAKDTNVVLDGEKLNSKLQKIQSTKQLNANRNLGLV